MTSNLCPSRNGRLVVEWTQLADRIKYRITPAGAVPGKWLYMSLAQARSLRRAREVFYGRPTNSTGDLVEAGLVVKGVRRIERSYGPDLERQVYYLTPLGKEVGAVIKVEDQPRQNRDKRSRDNVKLTEPQVKVLQSWPSHKNNATPIGSSNPEPGRWIYVDKITPTQRVLLQMGLLEMGTHGIVLVDGEQHVARDGRNTPMMPSLALRITALGVVYSHAL